MKLGDFLLFLAAAVGLALWTVHEETRATRLGYRLGRLAAEREALVEKRQDLRFQRAKLGSPERLEALAGEFGLGLVPPGRDKAEEPTAPKRHPAPGPLGGALATHGTPGRRTR